MGSKKLKGIVVSGDRPVGVVDPEKLTTLRKRIFNWKVR
jgi:aldehyde:ferredoxin oxidoreductase